MRFGSVCSGIEAASVAWEVLGWKAAWFSEIEPFPCEVLKHHYPDVPNLGDMTALPQRIISGEVEAPDLFCGGTPCQAFSVAGLRKSLDDARGNLSLTFCEIADAIDNVRLAGGKHPAIIFWENVPGVLSTKDNAFGCFLAGLAGEDGAVEPPGGKWANAGCVYGPQRAVAWRVLDAQYFGVAQRRRRVFVVASARADFDPAAVLFEFDGVRRDSAPSRKAGETVAPTIAGCANGGGANGPGRDVDSVESLQPYAVGNTLTARMHKGMNSTLDEGQTPVVAFSAKDYGADATANLSPTLRAGNSHEGNQNSGAWMAVAFHPTQDPISSSDGTTHAMGCGSSGGMATIAVAQPLNIYGGNKRQDRPEGGFYVRMDEDTSKTLDAATGLNPTCSQGGTAVMQPMAWSIMPQNSGKDYKARQVDVLQPLMAGGVQHGNQGGDIIQTAMQVRRLTPVECERLQGFPDGYTQIPWRKKPASECPDGPRYKALGNSWAVPVVRWIGKRIQEAIE
jgi:DNA (cytosine-5)-methyltransferase 1